MTAYPRKKKKVDYEALGSAFMRIPGMDVLAARALLDLGFLEIYQLAGRSPEALFEAHKKQKPEALIQVLWAFRMLVYVAENTEELDPKKLKLSAWI